MKICARNEYLNKEFTTKCLKLSVSESSPHMYWKDRGSNRGRAIC